jgi:hypothetical protein
MKQFGPFLDAHALLRHALQGTSFWRVDASVYERLERARRANQGIHVTPVRRIAEWGRDLDGDAFMGTQEAIWRMPPS